MEIDPCRCPLCGHENDCGMAKGEPTCWCMSLAVPKAVLERVPLAAQGVACVCRACATGQKDATTVAEQIRELLRRH